MSQVVLINGKKQTKLSVFNRLTQFGDGLFETCLVKEGHLLFWSEHFTRLEKGRTQLKINRVSQKQWLKDIAKALSISKLDHAVVKVMLSRGESVRGYGFEKKIIPTRVIIVTDIPTISDTYELSVCHSGYATNSMLSGIKHCNRLEQVLARIDMSTQECIMLDENGYVISATQGNIFAVKLGVLLTPGLDECGIEGTRRNIIIELARDLDIQVEIGELSMTELLESDEVFISNSVIGIRSVQRINEQSFTIGSVSEKLKHALLKLQRSTNYQVKLKKQTVYLKNTKRLVLVLIALSIIWAYSFRDVTIQNSTVYQLPIGSNIHTVAEELENLGHVGSARYVVVLSKILGLENQLKQGYYQLEPNMSVTTLLYDFSLNKVATRKITLVEGKTIFQYYQQLSNNPALNMSGDFFQTMKLAEVKPPYEGYFWPDTYQVNYGDSVASVFKRANQIMQEKLNVEWQGRDKTLNLKNADKALILASLIEKETAHHQEKSQIAGVFMRRLKKGMRLQTDPSVVYALGSRYQGSLSKQDLKFNSPYNTYRHKGLPPTAIGSVGQASLRSAMHPASGDTLYFVAKKDGSHAFAKTYKQHRLNIKKYLK